MSTDAATADDSTVEARPEQAAPRRPRSPGRWAWPAGTTVVTFLLALVPAALRPEFYLRGDTAAQFAPTWFHLGQLLRQGQLPPLMDPASFAGGNYAAEALFGLWNPVSWVIWWVVSGSSDLLVTVTLVKAVVMALLALGTYHLAREYAAARWASAALAVALPFCGFTLFWDAGSWAAGLIAFAWTPWMWWAFRRTLHGRLNPFVAFLVGAMAVTQGNPYGTVAVAIVGLGLVVEGLVCRRWRGTAVLAVVGVCVAALLPLVYLPLVETVSLAARDSGGLVLNNGRLRPTIGDLFLLGSPTYVPPVEAITGPMRVPATYFCWFLVPLLPWLRLDGLRRRLPELSALGVAGLVWLAMTVGPSKLWLFRWPVRLTEYLFLVLAVLLALALSDGLARDRVRGRLGLSVLAVLLSGWLAWSQTPQLATRAAIGVVLVLVLTAAALAAHRWLPAVPAALAAVLVLGTAATTLVQVHVYGENKSSRVWHFPTDVPELQQRFSAYGSGTMVQIANLKPVQDSGDDRRLRALWRSYLAGSMFHVAGLQAVNNYTGMGLVAFTQALCMNYDGLARACGYQHLWQPVQSGQPSLADQLKLSTVVTQPAIARTASPEQGWRRDTSVRGQAVVLRRSEALPHPGSRLAWTSSGVTADRAASLGPEHERASVRAGSTGGTVGYALLGWPGWTATLDGKQVPWRRNAAGLLTVRLPAGASGVLDLHFSPPGHRLGLAAGAGATVVAGALGVLVAVGGRRGRSTRRRPRRG